MEKVIDLKNSQEQNEPRENRPDSLLEWRAHEYQKRDRSKSWFLAIGIVGGGASIFSFIIGNYIFAFLILLVIAVIFMYEVKDPKEYEYEITRRGIRIQNRLFDFPNLKSFWIFEHETGENELSLESKKALVPHVKANLGDTDPESVRAVLKRFIPEAHQEESLTDILARRFGL